jgi:hypothetical protein
VRQFLSWRYWAALGVLFALTALLWACQGGSNPTEVVMNASSRRIDLIAQTATIRSDGMWSVSGGETQGDATAVLQDGRVLTLADGTLAESSCLFPDALNACVLLADTLGDGVVWFALVAAPAEGTTELELPAIETLLDGVTYAQLSNGWELPLLDKVVRRCKEETPNLAAFVQKFSDRHVTIVDLAQSQVSAVRCLGQ